MRLTSRRKASSDSPCRAIAAPPDTKRLRRRESTQKFLLFIYMTLGIFMRLRCKILSHLSSSKKAGGGLNLLNLLNAFPNFLCSFVTARRTVLCLRRVTKPVRVKLSRTHHLRQSLKVRALCDGSIAHMRDLSLPQFSWSRQRRNEHLINRLHHLCKRVFFHTQYNGTILTIQYRTL